MTEGTGGYVNAGRLELTVGIDDTKLAADLKAKVAKASKGVDAEAGLKLKSKLDLTRTKLKEVLAEISAGVDAQVGLSLRANHGFTKTKLREAVAKVSAGIDAQIGIGIRGAHGLTKTKLRAVVQGVAAGVDANVGIDIKTVGLQRRINAATKAEDLYLRVRLEPTTRLLRSKLRALAREEDLSIGVGVNARGAGTGGDPDRVSTARQISDTDRLAQARRNLTRADLDHQDSLHRLHLAQARALVDENNLRRSVERSRKVRFGQKNRDLAAADVRRAQIAAEGSARALRRAQFNADTAAGRHRAAVGDTRAIADQHRPSEQIDADLGALRAKLDEATQTRDMRVNIETNIADAQAQLDALTRARDVRVQADAEVRAAEAELARVTEDRLAHIATDADVAEAEAKLDRVVQRRTAEIEADLGASLREVEAQLAELTAARNIALRADLDVTEFNARIADLTREREASIRANLDAAEARTQLEALARDHRATVEVGVDGVPKVETAIDVAARDRRTTVEVNADTSALSKLQTHMRFSEVRVLALTAALATVVPTIGPIGAAAAGAAAGLAAMGAAGLAGAGVVALSFQGIVNAVTAMRDVTLDATKNSVKQAQEQERLAGATEGVTAATDGLRQARENAGAAATASAERIRQADRGVTDATRAIADALRGVADANRTVQDSERGVTAAQQTALRAQEALTDARRAARRAMEDLALQIRGGQLDQEEANLAQIRAKRDLDAVLADPSASQEQRRQAQIDYEQAVLQVDELTLRNRRLAEEKAQTDKQGVEGSNQVRDAVRGVADANQGVIDSQRRVADAHRAVADAQRTVADAQRSLSDAERGASQARTDSARQARQSADSIVAAQRGVEKAQRALGKAIRDDNTETTGSVDKLRKALEGLTPAGRTFAEFTFTKLLPAFQGLQDAAASGFLPGLQGALTDALPGLQGLEGFVHQLALTLGDLAREAAAALDSPVWTSFFDYMDRTAGPFLQDLARILGNIATGFAGMLVAFEPVSVAFSNGLDDMARSFANWAAGLKNNDGFQRFLGYIIDVGPRVLDFLGSLVRAVVAIGEGLAPLGEIIIGTLTAFLNFIDQLPVGVITALGTAILFVVASTVALKLAHLAASIAIGIYQGAVLLATVATNLLNGSLTITEALLAVPLLLAAAVVVLVGVLFAAAGAFYYAWKNSETFRNVVTDTIDTVKRVLDELAGAFGGLIGQGAGFSSFGDLVISYMTSIALFIDRLAHGFEKLMNNFIKPLTEGRFADIGSEAGQMMADIARGEDALAAAHDKVRAAQDRLNESRQRAVERLQDLKAAQGDLALDVRGAVLDVASARRERDQAQKEFNAQRKAGKATPVDRERVDRAQLQFERAVAREARARAAVGTNYLDQQNARNAAPGDPNLIEAVRKAKEDEAAIAKQLAEMKDRLSAQSKDAGKSIGQSLIDGFTEILGISSPSTVFANFGPDIIQGLINGIFSMDLPTLISAVWTGLVTAFKAFFGIESPSTLFHGFGADIVQGLINGIFSLDIPTLISSVWSGLLGAFRTFFGLTGVKSTSTVFHSHGAGIIQGLINGVLSLKPLLTTTMAGLGAVAASAFGLSFDGLKAKAKAPVEFLIDTVINKGIVDTFNALTEPFRSLGVPKLGHVSLPATWNNNLGSVATQGSAVAAERRALALRSGGEVRGPGTTTSDSILTRLSRDEHVWSAREVRGAGGHAAMEKLRAAARAGQTSVPGFFIGGGLTEEIIAVARRSGVPFHVTSANRPGSRSLSGNLDYHSRGMAVDMADSVPQMQRLAGWFYQRYNNLLELIHSGGPGFFVKNRHRVGRAFYGSEVPGHYDHVHVAMDAPGISAIMGGAPLAADAGAGGSMADFLKAKMATLVGGALNGIPGKASPISKFIRAGASKVGQDLGGFVGSKIDSLPGGGLLGSALNFFFGDTKAPVGKGGTPAANQRIAAAMLAQFGWTQSQMAPLIRLWTGESGWVHTALNRASGAYGIPQALPASKMASAGADWQDNPVTQIRWGLNYIKSRYGSPAAALAFWLNHSPHWYDSGGDLQPGTSLVHNGTGRPEAVFTERMLSSVIERLDSVAQALAGRSLDLAPAAKAMLSLARTYETQTSGRGRGGLATTGLGAYSRNSLAPAAAVVSSAAGPIVNVYPRSNQSEYEIARLVSRELAWLEVTAQ